MAQTKGRGTKKGRAHNGAPPMETMKNKFIAFFPLVVQLSLDELAVQTGYVGDGLVLRALSLAGAGVGAVTESSSSIFIIIALARLAASGRP